RKTASSSWELCAGHGSTRAGRRPRAGALARAAPIAEQDVLDGRQQRRCTRGNAELPAEESAGRAATAQPPGVDTLLMMRGAQDRKVLVIITAAVRAVDDVVRVQVPAGRAAGDPGAPAVALEDPVTPPPGRVALDVPGLFEGIDHPGDALPVVQM